MDTRDICRRIPQSRGKNMYFHCDQYDLHIMLPSLIFHRTPCNKQNSTIYRSDGPSTVVESSHHIENFLTGVSDYACARPAHTSCAWPAPANESTPRKYPTNEITPPTALCLNKNWNWATTWEIQTRELNKSDGRSENIFSDSFVG